MKAKKLNKVEELEKKLHTAMKMIQFLSDESRFLKNLSVGTFETIKLMPDYEKAIQKLKEQSLDEAGEAAGSEKKLEPLG